jgi:hypothetical protein
LQVFIPNGIAPNLAVVAGFESLKQARYLLGPLERRKLGDGDDMDGAVVSEDREAHGVS